MKEIKKVTTDELAIMINNGFKGVDKKFEKITEDLSEKFDKIDKKFEGKFDEINRKVDKIDENFDSIAIITNDGFIEAREDRNRIESNLTSIIRMDKERKLRISYQSG